MSIRHILNTYIHSFEKEYKTLNRVEIHRGAMLHNVDLLQKISPTFGIIPVLKSNAYGHGLEQIVDILQDLTFPYVAVDGFFEALQIRTISNLPILVMGYIHPNNYRNIDTLNYTFVVHDEISVKALGSLGKRITIHLELETGMNRMGVKLPHLSALLATISSYPNLQLEGVMTHLADADNENNTFTEQQTHIFDEGVDIILRAGFTPALFHIAQSAGSTKVTSKYANTLRVGIALFGINPLLASDPQHKVLANLEPSMSVVSTVVKILEIEAGEVVSYGCTFKAKRPTTVAVIPFGYYEGLPRTLSNRGSVTKNETVLPIIGRICMNHTMLNVTNTNITWGDEITVISNRPSDKNSIESICRDNNYFNYQLLVGINQTIRRYIV